MSEPFVVACTPIRNRGWILHDHMAAVLPHQGGLTARLFYLTGDNEDDTLTRLRICRRAAVIEAPDEPPIVFEEFNTGSPFWHRSRPGEKYSGDDHLSLSRVYNKMIDRALALFPEASHLWLVDSDVLPEPGCLEKLLEAKVDVIAPVVQHSPNAFNFMVDTYIAPDAETQARWGAEEPRRSGQEASLLGMAWAQGVAFPATFVSCCVLYRREVLEAEETVMHVAGGKTGSDTRRPAHRFAPHPRSHDFPMMASLRASGVKLWVHPRARAEHRMQEPEGWRP